MPGWTITDIKYHKAEGIAKLQSTVRRYEMPFGALTVSEISQALNDAREDEKNWSDYFNW